MEEGRNRKRASQIRPRKHCQEHRREKRSTQRIKHIEKEHILYQTIIRYITRKVKQVKGFLLERYISARVVLQET